MRNSPSPFAVDVHRCPVCKLRSVNCAPGTGLLAPVAVLERTTPSTAAVLDACCRGMRIAGPCSRDGVACPEESGWGSCADATPAGSAAGTATKKITAQAVRSATDTVLGKDIALLSCSKWAKGQGSGIYITASGGNGQQFSECSQALPTSALLR